MSSRRSLAKVYDAAVRFAHGAGGLMRRYEQGLAIKAGPKTSDKPSKGERRFAQWQGPVNGVPGANGSSQIWQIQQYQGWCYVAINFISTNFACCKPAVVKVLGYGEKEKHAQLRVKAARMGREVPLRRRFVPNLVTKSSVGSRPQEEEYEYLPESPLAKLLADPNGPSTGYSLWYLGSIFYELTGDCYLYKQRNGAGQVVELWLIPTHWVYPVSKGIDKVVDYYKIWPFTTRGNVVTDPDAEIVDVNDMVRIKKPSPFHPIASYSAVQSNAAELDTYGQITAARYLAIQNGMSFAGALELAAGAPEMDDDAIARYEARMQGHYGGIFNAGRVPIFPPGYTYKFPQAGRELEYMETQEQLRKHILIGFDLDESYFMSKESTDANAVELRHKMHMRVLRPRQEMWSSELTERLARDDFGDDQRVIYPYVPSQTREEERADWQLAMTANATTLNEFRTGFMNLEAREEPEADMLWTNPGLIPLATAEEYLPLTPDEQAQQDMQMNSGPTNEDDTKLDGASSNEENVSLDDFVFKSHVFKAFDESKHPRGQPENAGEFASGPGGGGGNGVAGGLGAPVRKPHQVAKPTKIVKPAGVSNASVSAVKDYTEDHFQKVNGQLRSKEPMTPEVEKMVAGVDEYLDKSPKYEKPTIRSFTVPDDQVDAFAEKLKEGGTFSDPAFASTRKTPTLSDKAGFVQGLAPHGQVILKITGSSGVDISNMSKNPGEGEVLYPRDTKFRVVKMKRTDAGGILAEVEEIKAPKNKSAKIRPVVFKTLELAFDAH